MFYPTLPPIQRYAVSTLITLALAQATLSSVKVTYYMGAVVAVLILGSSTSAWPAPYDHPFVSTSLHEFWGKRWQQMMRRTLMVLGGIPGQRLAGRIGLVFGVFMASGILHELAGYTIPRPFDHRVTVCFVLQAVGINLEDIYRRMTGRRVSGKGGWLWAMIFLVVSMQMAVDAWLILGFYANPGPLPMLNAIKIYFGASIRRAVDIWICG